jgi:hypothetical protein
MIKRTFINIGVILFIFVENSAFAGVSGSPLEVAATGTPADVSITLCLNEPALLSCEDQVVSATTLTIQAAANHAYPSAGIKINTQGFTFSDCVTNEQGYCLFSVSNSAPKTIIITQLDYLTDSNQSVTESFLPSNILDPQPPYIPTQTCPVNVSVQKLETIYDENFCQLNAKLGVTLNSPGCVALKEYIKAQPGTGHFDLNAKPIINNGLGITDVNFQPITYQTTVPLLLPYSGPNTFTVSGGLLMPIGNAPIDIKGIVVYFHGTQFNKADVGSNINFVETQTIAAVFASQGYITIIPDYIGQGIDWHNVHPYVLYPQVNAKTAIDMLTSPEVQSAIMAQYPGITAPLKLFSAGYSEGGAYSLWFNTYITNNAMTYPSGIVTGSDVSFKLTHSVGLEGAYNTSSVTKGFLFDNVKQLPPASNTYLIQRQALTNAVKPLLTADAYLSYATYGYATPSYKSVFNMNFFNMHCQDPKWQAFCNTSGSRLNIADAFAQANSSPAPQLLISALGKSTGKYAFPNNILSLTIATNNSSISFSSSVNFPEDPGMNAALLAANVNLSELSTDAVSVVTLSHDSVVTPVNFNKLVKQYPTKILNAITLNERELMVVSPLSYLTTACSLYPSDPTKCKPSYIPVDHMQALIYEYLYALNIFNTF